MESKAKAPPCHAPIIWLAACCHVSVSPGGQHVVAANYVGGSVVAISRKTCGSLDDASSQYVVLPPCGADVTFPGPNAGRQEGAHAHKEAEEERGARLIAEAEANAAVMIEEETRFIH